MKEKSREYLIEELVMVRTHESINKNLHGMLGVILYYYLASGVYLVKICRTKKTVILSKEELLPALYL